MVRECFSWVRKIIYFLALQKPSFAYKPKISYCLDWWSIYQLWIILIQSLKDHTIYEKEFTLYLLCLLCVSESKHVDLGFRTSQYRLFSNSVARSWFIWIAVCSVWGKSEACSCLPWVSFDFLLYARQGIRCWQIKNEALSLGVHYVEGKRGLKYFRK